MKGKRLIAGVLALVLALWLPGCSGKKVKIGICLSREADPQFTQAVENTWDQEAYDLVTLCAQGDQTSQDQQIRQLLQEGCDLLVVEPVMADACPQILRLLQKEAVPVIFVGKEPGAEVLGTWEKACFVGCDRALASRLQGQVILETEDRGDINDDGVVTYAVINGPEDDLDAQARLRQCTQLLTQAGIRLEQLECRSREWSAEHGANGCQWLLSRYGRDLEVLFCGDDTLALGALDTISGTGWKVGKDLYLVGCGGEQTAVELVRSGQMTGTVGPDTAALVLQLEQTARLLLAGEPVQDQYYIPYVMVTGEAPEA